MDDQELTHNLTTWLSSALQSIGYTVEIDETKGLASPVLVNGLNVGTLETCYEEFRNDALIDRLRVQVEGRK